MSLKPYKWMNSKFGNLSSKCILKHWHQSCWEAEVCNYLYKLARDKKIKGYIPQKSIGLYVRKQHICEHIIDFYVLKNNGGKFFCEAKGYENPVWAIKRKLTRVLYPKIPYVTVYRGQLNLIDKELIYEPI